MGKLERGREKVTIAYDATAAHPSPAPKLFYALRLIFQRESGGFPGISLVLANLDFSHMPGCLEEKRGMEGISN
jgi:hypothetical protein